MIHERLERRVELRREWACKATARLVTRFWTSSRVTNTILPRPYSECRHRRDLDRIDRNMMNFSEERGLRHELDRSARLPAEIKQ